MKTWPVCRATFFPITSGHASTSLRCSNGVSNPVERKNCTSSVSIFFTSRLNIKP